MYWSGNKGEGLLQAGISSYIFKRWIIYRSYSYARCHPHVQWLWNSLSTFRNLRERDYRHIGLYSFNKHSGNTNLPALIAASVQKLIFGILTKFYGRFFPNFAIIYILKLLCDFVISLGIFCFLLKRLPKIHNGSQLQDFCTLLICQDLPWCNLGINRIPF